MEVLFDLDKCSFKEVVEQKLDWARSMRGEEVKTIWGDRSEKFCCDGEGRVVLGGEKAIMKFYEEMSVS